MPTAYLTRYTVFMHVAIVSVFVYAVFLLLLVWGVHFARIGSFNEDFMSVEANKNLQGIAALGVILHHISQSAPMDKLGQMQAFRNIGFLFVAFFFFVSGYGLLKSLDTKPNYLNGFFKKRVLPIIICYYVMNAFYIVWHLILGTKMQASEWVCKILGIALLNDNAWFVPVIIIMYVSFYFIFKNEKHRSLSLTLIFLVVALQAGWFLFNKHFPWWLPPKDWWKNLGFERGPWYRRTMQLWYEGEWWVNSTIAFLFGMLFAQKEKSIVSFLKRLYPLKLILAAALLVLSFYLSAWGEKHGLGYWLEYSNDISTKPRALMLLLQTVQVFAWLLFFATLRLKVLTKNPVLKFFGRHSLEIYLAQAIPIRSLCMAFGWTDKSYNPVRYIALYGRQGELKALLYLVLAVALTIPLALAIKFLTARIKKLL